MSIDVSTTTIVGLSYIDRNEEEDFHEGVLEVAADDLGLNFAFDMSGVDEIHDCFIGVSFDERPTDAEVEAAKKEVAGKLEKIKAALGEPSSAIQIWTVTQFCG